MSSIPTPLVYPGQRVLRTIFTTALTILPLIPQVIAILDGSWDASWFAGVSAQAVAINGALSALIALPDVDYFLTYIGLGTVPRKAAFY